MLRPPGQGHGNGYHHQQPQQHQQNGGGGPLIHKHRRGNRGRRSRFDYGDGSSSTRVSVSDGEDTRPPPPLCTDFDMAYFHSYAHLGIHEEMIKDRVRTETYRAAIMHHQQSIAGKVVLDVGCGTGILSIFCAQAGAKRVYAVDASDIAVQANEVVRANKLSDTVIVLHGRIEDVQIDEEVDVIISEWMGYMLLYESMLGSIITARDRWLKPGGLILPSDATLYIAPISQPDRYSESIEFWRNVYGIDMSAMLPLAKQCAFEEPSVETISGENVLTWPHVVKHVDCYTITRQELESVTTRFKFKSMMRAPFHGFAFWFDVEFSSPEIFSNNNNQPSSVIESPNEHPTNGSQRKKRANPNEALVLSTAPEDPPTHWQQTLIYFYDPIEVEQDQQIEGAVTLSQSKENPRFMNIHLEYASGGRSFVKESVMR
ncbi:probable protein arginine N-methyltransferase 6 [Rhododendron vialii]|uniref:probable protein arginine N-methyltransferase 6 n=1 Tax=Rhododendron vialii TaxID=182163 RepID=UPI00266018F4|nr:probable protein arginine N-methyltransferase 6 [Rhododendron vialii]